MIDPSTAKHRQHCRAAGCTHFADAPGIGSGWCAQCRQLAFTDDVPASFGHWFAGLTDGEGCFWIHKCRGGAFYSPQFKIKLRADDRSLLVLCRDVLKIGNLYNHAATKSHGRNAKPSVTWAVQSHADALKLATVFARYPLRSKKARDLATWCNALDLAGSMPRGNRWKGPRDWSQMLALKTKMETTRQYKETR